MKPTPQLIFGHHKKTGHDITAKKQDGHYVLRYMQGGNLVDKYTGTKAGCYAEKAKLVKFYGYKEHLFEKPQPI